MGFPLHKPYILLIINSSPIWGLSNLELGTKNQAVCEIWFEHDLGGIHVSSLPRRYPKLPFYPFLKLHPAPHGCIETWMHLLASKETS